jgi:hypothetical protein
MDKFPGGFEADNIKQRISETSSLLKTLRKEIFESIDEKGYFEGDVYNTKDDEGKTIGLELKILVEELKTRGFFVCCSKFMGPGRVVYEIRVDPFGTN